MANDFKEAILNIDNEVCEVIIPPVDCPTCIPNPNATIPDWTTLDQTEPFLNEKTCKYSIVVETDYKVIEGDEQLSLMLTSAILEGIAGLISFYDKDPLYEVQSGINVHQFLLESATPENITNLDFYVNTKYVPIKVLVTVPADIFNAIPSIPELPEEDQPPENNEDSDDDKPPVDVSYNPKELESNIDTYLNGLLYLSFLFDKDRIKKKARLRVFSLLESHYQMKKYTNKILDFMKDNLVIDFEKVDGIKIYYKEDFSKIKKIEVKKIGCDYKEIKKKKVTYLNSSPMTNFINNILFSQMEQSVAYFQSSGETASWEEFVTNFLPPDISGSLVKEGPSGQNEYSFDSSSRASETPPTTNNKCKNIEKAKEKAKQAFKKVGRNIKNEVLSYPEAIFNTFTEELCKSLRQAQTPEDYIKLRQEAENRIKNTEERIQRLKDAKLRELCADDSLFSELVFNLLGKHLTKPGAKEEDNACVQLYSNQHAKKDKKDDSKKVTNFSDLFDNFLSKVTKCTILGIVKETLDCVAQGMGEDDLLLLGIKKTIELVDSEDKIRQIIEALPDEMEAGFRQAFEKATSSGIYPWESKYKGGFYDPGVAGPTGLIPEDEISEGDIIEDDFIIEAGERPPGKLIIQTENGPYRVDVNHNGIVKNFGAAGTLGTLADDILDVFTDYMLGLLDSAAQEELEKLKESLSNTGIGRAVFEVLNFTVDVVGENECGLPPLFDPPLKDLAKTFTFDPCGSEPTRWTAPTFTKYKNIQAWDDTYFSIKETVFKKLEDLAFGAFKLVLGKSLSTAVNLSCQAITATTANFLEGGCDLKALLQESLCGEKPEESPYALNTDDESIAAAVNEIADAIGAWDGTTKPTDECMQKFIDSISSVLTNGEMKTLLNGAASEETLKIVFSLAKTLPDDCDMTSIFSSPEQFGSLFSGLGNLIDDDLINEVLEGDASAPLNSDICEDPSSLKDFDDLRKQILENKGLTPEQAQDQIDKAKQRNIDAASDFLDALLNPDSLMQPKPPRPSCIPEDGSPQANELEDLLEGKTSSYQEELNEDFKDLFKTIESSLVNDVSGYFDYVLSSIDGVSFKTAAAGLVRSGKSADKRLPLTVDQMTYNSYYGGNTASGAKDYSSFRKQIFGDESDIDRSIYEKSGSRVSYLAGVKYEGEDLESVLTINDSFLEHKNINKQDSTADGKIKFNFLNDNLYSLQIKNSLSEYSLTGTYSKDFNLAQYSQYFGNADLATDTAPSAIFTNKSKSDLERFFPEASSISWSPILRGMYLNVHKLFAGYEAREYYLHGYNTTEAPTTNYSEAAMEVLGVGSSEDPAFFYSGDYSNNYEGYYKSYLKLSPSPEIDSEAEFFINYDDIAKKASKNVEEFPEDERLQSEDPSCVIEPPYGLIVDTYGAASIEAILRTTLRTILTEQLMNMLHMNSMTELEIEKDGILNHIYANILIEKVKQELIRLGDLKSYGFLYTKKTFYYNFKEQIVQSFSNRIKTGEVTPTIQEQIALDVINLKQSHWKEPKTASNKTTVKAQKYSRFMTETEKYSDIILRRYIVEELEKVTSAFSDRLKPSIRNIQSLFFGNKSPDSQFFKNKHDPTNWPCNIPKNIEDDWYSESYEASNLAESPFILEKFVKIHPKSDIPETIKDILNLEEMQGVINFDVLNSKVEAGLFDGYSFEDLFESISIGLRIVLLYKSSSSGKEYELGSYLRENLSFDAKKSAKRTKAVITGIGTDDTIAGTSADKPIASSVICETSIPLDSVSSLTARQALATAASISNYNSQFPCLTNNLMETESYKLYFEYLFPIKTLVSLVVTYHQDYFMGSLRRREKYKNDSGNERSNLDKLFFSIDKGLFDNTKQVCKTLFESLYYSKYEKTSNKFIKEDNPSQVALKRNNNLFSISDTKLGKKNIFQKSLKQPKDNKLITLGMEISPSIEIV